MLKLKFLLIFIIFASCANKDYSKVEFHLSKEEAKKIKKKKIYSFTADHNFDELDQIIEEQDLLGEVEENYVPYPNLSKTHLNKRNKYQFSSGRYRGHYKVGNPYEIAGVRYFPREYTNYKEVGAASWYGPQFHKKKTANGEIFNMNHLTAAHKTLPMPSIVRVTNLENNKSIVVRVNDRGPFKDNRIIDLSKQAAYELGFLNQGTTNVKVELLVRDTQTLLSALQLKDD